MRDPNSGQAALLMCTGCIRHSRSGCSDSRSVYLLSPGNGRLWYWWVRLAAVITK